ncbi:MAG: hypothetical protein DRJ03_09340 [Chloroflexi bacterium]|nr:MAG: hypothetical protein DRJ03_09340 [Chloroflexota bacterium]
MRETPIFFLVNEKMHLLFLANGHPQNLEWFEAEINRMQPEGARLREIRLYDLSLPEERLEEFIEALTSNPKHSVPHLTKLARFFKLLAPFLGYKPININLSKKRYKPRVGYVKTVIIGVKPDPKNLKGEEII